MKYLIAILLLLSFSYVAKADILIDATSTLVLGVASTTQAFNHTVIKNYDGLIMCNVLVGATAGTASTINMTDNGVNMTKLYIVTSTTASQLGAINLWYMLNPPIGNNHISSTLTNVAAPFNGCISYQGVDPQVPIDLSTFTKATSSKSTNGFQVTTSTNYADELYTTQVALIGAAGITISPSFSETVRISTSSGAQAKGYEDISDNTPGSITSGWTPSVVATGTITGIGIIAHVINALFF